MSSARKKGASARAGAGGGGASARAGAKKADKKPKAGGKAAAASSGGGAAGGGGGEGYSQLGLLEVVQKRFLKDVFDQAKGATFRVGETSEVTVIISIGLTFTCFFFSCTLWLEDLNCRR